MVEGARLESVYTGNRIVGSNPTPSAKSITHVIDNNHISKLVIQLAPQLVPQGNTNSG